MAVIHRPSPHKFIQQACREACREASRAGKAPQSTLPHLSQGDLRYLSGQDWNPSHPTQVNKSFESTCTKHSDSLSVPYDQASKRRVAMALVDLCTAYMEGLWPQRKSRLPLRRFIFEILRRSRVQYPVFQVALCYLARLGPVIKGYAQNQQPIPEILACSRRVLVAALQVASKFLQDRCYSASVWARISGLPLDDLKRNELALMEALQWNLFVSYDAYMHSCRRLRISADTSFLIKAVSPSTRPTPLSTMPTPTNSPISAPIHAPVSPEIEIWSTN